MRLAPLFLTAAVAMAVPAGAATLSGFVRDANGGPMHPMDLDVYESSGGGALVPTPGDTTTALGFYSISLSPGTYDIEFNPVPGSHWFVFLERSLTISGNATLDVTLVRGHYLSGRVVDGLGAGVANADLDFHDPATGDTPVNVQGARTDSAGFFTALVDSAVWNVSVIPPLASRLVPLLIPGVDLRADQSLGEIAVAAGTLAQGTVTDDGFFPIADADLDVRPAGGGAKLFTPQDNTAADGSWALVLPPGNWDITADAPPLQPYASATAWSVAISGSDVAVPNLALPPGLTFRGRCVNGLGGAIAGVDLDVDSLPLGRRLATANDLSDATGQFQTLVSAWKFRVTLTPPVATKRLPVRLDSVQVTTATDLGDLVFPAGHWVSGNVVESGTGVPIVGANLDWVRVSTGSPAITAGDVTVAGGAFQVTTDADLYRLVVAPPDASHDTLVVEPFRTLADTAVTLALVPSTTGVGPLAPRATLMLEAPRPNPAHGVVRFAFRSEEPAAELAVWDVGGRRIATLHRGSPATGTVTWDGRGDDGRRVAAGVYLVRLAGPSRSVSRRLVYMP